MHLSFFLFFLIKLLVIITVLFVFAVTVSVFPARVEVFCKFRVRVASCEFQVWVTSYELWVMSCGLNIVEFYCYNCRFWKRTISRCGLTIVVCTCIIWYLNLFSETKIQTHSSLLNNLTWDLITLFHLKEVNILPWGTHIFNLDVWCVVL